MDESQNSHPIQPIGLDATPTKSITKRVVMGAESNIRRLTYAINSTANCLFLI
jgi:hypothetical protein